MDDAIQSKIPKGLNHPAQRWQEQATLKELYQSQTYRSSNSISYCRKNSRNSVCNPSRGETGGGPWSRRRREPEFS
jgi:hypothetical protein